MGKYKAVTGQDQPRSGDLSAISAKDEKWDSHRSGTQSVEGLYATDSRFFKYSKRLSDCSTLLGFSESSDGSIKLKRASFCRVRHCPVCGWRRAMASVARFMKRLPDLTRLYPTHRYIFLTLTVRNCPPDQLRAKLRDMNRGWKRMIERTSRTVKDPETGRPVKTFGWPATGFIRSTEITKGKNGSAHPHFHALLQVPSDYFRGRGYIKHEMWLQAWRDCMRDQSIMSVNIKTVKPKVDGETLQAAICETLKYSVKPGDIVDDKVFLFACTEQLQGLRFLSTGGTLKDLLKDEVGTDEMIGADEPGEPDEDKEASVWFGWNRSRRRYVKRRDAE